MYIILVGPGEGFPNGNASTSRINLYARGLINAGGRVLILCLGPSEYPDVSILNRDVKGDKDGVEFEYTSGTPIRGKTHIEQKWLVFKGFVMAAWRIWCLNNTKCVNALILYSDRGIAILFFWFIAKLCRAKYIYECNEQPFYQAEYSIFWRVVSFIFTHTLYLLFDGAIVISNYLCEYMLKRMRPSASLLKVPILVDVEQFSSVTSSALISGKYIAYCGTLNEAKDGVYTLMKAYAKIYDEFPNLKLVLIGDTIKESRITTFRFYAENLGISDRVVFTGRVARNELPSYMAHASLLALARPYSRQSEAGFSTKLGEYLVTGKPVLVTKTGEISDYLEDNTNIFMAPPNDVAAFAERIRYILLHANEAEVVGRNGRDAAFRHFDYRENGRKIKNFIDHL